MSMLVAPPVSLVPHVIIQNIKCISGLYIKKSNLSFLLAIPLLKGCHSWIYSLYSLQMEIAPESIKSHRMPIAWESITKLNLTDLSLMMPSSILTYQGWDTLSIIYLQDLFLGGTKTNALHVPCSLHSIAQIFPSPAAFPLQPPTISCFPLELDLAFTWDSLYMKNAASILEISW